MVEPIVRLHGSTGRGSAPALVKVAPAPAVVAPAKAMPRPSKARRLMRPLPATTSSESRSDRLELVMLCLPGQGHLARPVKEISRDGYSAPDACQLSRATSSLRGPVKVGGSSALRRLATPEMQKSRRIAPPANVSSMLFASDLVRKLDDEILPVRHLHLRQAFGIHRIALTDEFVGGENISGERIDLIVAECARAGPRHRTAEVVKQRS